MTRRQRNLNFTLHTKVNGRKERISDAFAISPLTIYTTANDDVVIYLGKEAVVEVQTANKGD